MAVVHELPPAVPRNIRGGRSGSRTHQLVLATGGNFHRFLLPVRKRTPHPQAIRRWSLTDSRTFSALPWGGCFSVLVPLQIHKFWLDSDVDPALLGPPEGA